MFWNLCIRSSNPLHKFCNKGHTNDKEHFFRMSCWMNKVNISSDKMPTPQHNGGHLIMQIKCTKPQWRKFEYLNITWQSAADVNISLSFHVNGSTSGRWIICTMEGNRWKMFGSRIGKTSDADFSQQTGSDRGTSKANITVYNLISMHTDAIEIFKEFKIEICTLKIALTENKWN